MFDLISKLMIPCIVLFIVIYGIIKKTDIYDNFIEGAKESFEMILNTFPCYLAMILAINIFISSGFLSYILNMISPVISLLNIPLEIIPLALMRPLSGGTSLALLNNLLTSFSPDGIVGLIGSCIQGSTDTTFYVITLYFGSVGIKKIKYAMWVGLFSDLVAIVSAIILINLFF